LTGVRFHLSPGGQFSRVADSSRRLPWHDRPEAAALLAALLDPARGFGAIVVGEYERAFAADQFEQLAPILNQHGVQAWIPEAGGPVEAGSPLHRMRLAGCRCGWCQMSCGRWRSR
jgi:hypothetical protein